VYLCLCGARGAEASHADAGDEQKQKQASDQAAFEEPPPEEPLKETGHQLEGLL
jgi:hypothetical protein